MIDRHGRWERLAAAAPKALRLAAVRGGLTARVARNFERHDQEFCVAVARRIAAEEGLLVALDTHDDGPLASELLAVAEAELRAADRRRKRAAALASALR